MVEVGSLGWWVATLLGSVLGAMCDPVLIIGSSAVALLQTRWRMAALGALIFTPIYIGLAMMSGSPYSHLHTVGAALACQAWAAILWALAAGVRRLRASRASRPSG